MAGGLRIASVIAGIAGLFSTQAAVAEPSLNDLAARIELRPIETLTLTDQQFLTGDKNGKAVTIAGELPARRHWPDARSRAAARLGRRQWRQRAVGQALQRDGDRGLPARQLLGARDRQHLGRPGAARPPEHDPRRLSQPRDARR